MSQRLERLQQLLEMKMEVTKAAHQQLMLAQEEFKKNKLKLDQLVGYRQDYLKQLETLGEKGTEVRHLRNRIDFIAHVDVALSQLNGILANLAKIRSRAQLAYKEAKFSEEGVNLLIERVKKGLQSKLQRQEQKENDEYAQKQWYSNKIDEHE